MANYPSDPVTGNRSTLIVFVVVLLVLACAGAAGAVFLTSGG